MKKINKKLEELVKKENGSIALISVLVISSILIILAVSMSEANISNSYQYLNKYSDQIAYTSAEACLEESLIRLEENTNFSGTTLAFDDTVCTSTILGAETKTISIVVNYLEYEQNFEAQVSVTANGQANNVRLLNWGKI